MACSLRNMISQSHLFPHPPPDLPCTGALNWLSNALLRELWPQLSQVLSIEELRGSFLSPLCKSLAIVMRALQGRCQDSLPSIVQAMVNCMFR